MRWLWIVGAVTVVTLALLGWWMWSQRPPERMDAEKYGIAIAEFSVNDREAPAPNNELGLLIARRIAGFLEYEEAELAETIGAPVQVWGSDRPVEPVQQQADVERASAIGADVLVYGSVRYTEGTWQIEPRFYLSDEVIGTASELTGEYALGTPIRFTPGNTASEAELTKAMRTRLRALTQLLMGLSHYSAGTTSSYQKAATVFQAAAQDADWGAAVEKSGQEVLYLFLGNAWLKLGSLTVDPSLRTQFFAESRSAYQTALQYNPAYARVYNGLGDLYFQQALLVEEERDDCATDWDWEILDQSTDAYAQALAVHQEAALPSGNVALRAHLGLGRALYFQGLCLSSEIEPPEWVQAREHHRAVLSMYKTDPSAHVRFLAALAQLDLADMAFKQADWRLYEDIEDDEGHALLEEAANSYRDALLLLTSPLTEEELRLAVNMEGKLLVALCWQQKPEEAQASLREFLQTNPVAEEIEEILREIQQSCEYPE
jgi:tetratricopeptide (TPR) repeat protein